MNREKLTKLIPEQNISFTEFFDKFNQRMQDESDTSKKLWLNEAAITKIVKEFQGLCTTIVFDKVIDNNEIDLLFEWRNYRRDFMTRFPLDEFNNLLNQIKPTEKYSQFAKERIFQLIDTAALHFDRKVIQGIYDYPEKIIVSNMEFVLTGTFNTGEKKDVAKLITDRGGVVAKDVRQSTDILVVGSEGNENYTYGQYGRKIEKMLEKRKANEPVMILDEDYFIKYLN
ncbi:MAG: BRCT domain-containing protein [Ignavibacteriaceae bacterium]|nr:BRCT domain-containing protein [Ignavibacteriaceae bacterium]